DGGHNTAVRSPNLAKARAVLACVPRMDVDCSVAVYLSQESTMPVTHSAIKSLVGIRSLPEGEGGFVIHGNRKTHSYELVTSKYLASSSSGCPSSFRAWRMPWSSLV